MEDKQVTDENVLNGVEEIGDIDLASIDLNNLPSDPEELLKLVNGDQKIPEEKNEEEEESDEKPDPESSTESKEEEAPVLSADGKHQIPYSVLRRERDARRQTESENASLHQQLESLKQQKPSEASQAIIPELDHDDPEVKALEEEFPEIAKINKAARAENQRLRQEIESQRSKVETMYSEWEKEKSAKQQVEVEKVNSEIDSNPVLRYLRAEGDESLWKAAVEIDQRLQNSPAWADKPISERFSKVVERLEEDFGPVKVPAEYQSPARKTAAKTTPKPQIEDDEDDLTINTLSDLKGGSSPESSGVNAENLTAADIGNIFLKMDPSHFAKMDPVEILRRL